MYDGWKDEQINEKMEEQGHLHVHKPPYYEGTIDWYLACDKSVSIIKMRGIHLMVNPGMI